MASSDWELVPNSAPQQSASSSQSDWEVVPNVPLSRQPNPNEGFKEALTKAPFRIGEDVSKGIMGAVKSIPGLIDSAKTEIPGMLDPLSFHPIQRGKQALAGLTELGHGVLNSPKGIADYLANRLNFIPKSLSEKVPYQKDISSQIDKAFGNPTNPGDALVRGTFRNALSIIPGGRAASVLNPMNLTAKSIAKDVLNTAENNKKLYSQKYDSVWNEAKQKGISDLSNISPYLDIDTLREFTPKRKIVGVEEFVKNPTLENAHRAKSDLLALDRKLNDLTTMNQGERKHSVAVKNAITDLQDNMFRTPIGDVDTKLANKYNAIQKGYATEVIPYKNKHINKFKQGKMSAKELVNALSSGEFAAMRGKHHPAIGIRNMSPFARNASLLGLGLGAGGLGKVFYDDLTDTRVPE